MARLIDADALFIHGAVPFITNDGFATAEKIKSIIAKAPTVDAVEVVRCKDCRDRVAGYCAAEIDGIVKLRAVKDDDFCSYGERRTNGEEAKSDIGGV